MNEITEKKEGSKEKSKLSIKSKMIAALIGAGILTTIGYSLFSSLSPKDIAIDVAKAGVKKAGQVALDKGKEKLQEFKDKNSNVSAPSTSPQAPAAPIEVNGVNVLKNVESANFISIDNQAIPAEAADIQLMNAINVGDLDRVKFLLDSGVNPEFTDRNTCLAKQDGTFDHEATIMPKDPSAMKSFISVLIARKGTVITSKCSKLFLLSAASKLNSNFNKDEFEFYNRAWNSRTAPEAIERDKQKISEESKREDIYRLLLTKTSQKDLYQLPLVFLNPKVPYSIRSEALSKYLEVDESKLPMTESRKAFKQLFAETAGLNGIADDSPWRSFASDESVLFLTAASKLQISTESLVSSNNVDRKYNTAASNVEVPKLTVDSFKQGGIKYTESQNNIFWYKGVGRGTGIVEKYDFQMLHDVNKEIQIINTIVDSKMVNLNFQDAAGNSILHYLSSDFRSTPRSIAVLSRFYLNTGVNANFINKKGETALSIAQNASSKQGSVAGGWDELSKAYTDKNFN